MKRPKVNAAPKGRASGTGRGRPGSARTVRTLDGAEVPERALAHIAPHLRPFAVLASSLVPDPDNAKKHGDHDLKSTAASLRRFGQQELIQYEQRGKRRIVKVGSGRLAAATDPKWGLNWTYVAAVPSNLSAGELRAFALVHNRTGERAPWDPARLEAELKALRESAEFSVPDLSDFGFESEMQRLYGEMQQQLAAATRPRASIDQGAVDDAAEGDAGDPGERDFEPQGPETQPRLDQPKAVTCPQCRHEFHPGPRKN